MHACFTAIDYYLRAELLLKKMIFIAALPVSSIDSVVHNICVVSNRIVGWWRFFFIILVLLVINATVLCTFIGNVNALILSFKSRTWRFCSTTSIGRSAIKLLAWMRFNDIHIGHGWRCHSIGLAVHYVVKLIVIADCEARWQQCKG